MGIAAEILKLRNDPTSSVSLLLGAIEWAQATKNHDIRVMRSHAIKQAADLVILNVAVYAQETQNEPPVRGNRRATATPRRSQRRWILPRSYINGVYSHRRARSGQIKA